MSFLTLVFPAFPVVFLELLQDFFRRLEVEKELPLGHQRLQVN